MGCCRRAVAIALTWILVVSVGLVVGAEPALTRPATVVPSWLTELVPATPADDPVAPPMPVTVGAPLGRSRPAPADTATFPEPATGAGIVSLSARDVTSPTARLETLDRAAAARAGVSGFVFRLSGVSAPTTVSVDYSGFAHAFGAGYADRLRFVVLPDCVLDTPRPTGCRAEGVPLPSRNDAAASTLTADLAASDGAMLLAVTSGVSGETGTFAATPLSSSGHWQVAPGSGEFSYTYDVVVPEPPAGTAPDVGLTYSSGAIDGMVSTGNTQGPRTGVGWSEFASSFVERRYTSCRDTVGTGDLCWKSHNATIALNGHSSELVPVDAARSTWRLKDDPGWTVDHLHLVDDSNGDDNGEYWKVTTPDGIQYFFGLGTNPDTQQATNSTWTVPVLADNSGEPCRGAGDVVGACEQAWRWNLDRVVDPNQMTTTYFYFKAMNRYKALGGLGGDVAHPYVRGGRLDRIEYGKPANTDGTVSAATRVVFVGEYRCVNLDDTCPRPVPGNASLFPDVPNDLVCDANCLVTTPTFFATDRYSAVRTEVRVGGVWKAVEQVNLYHAFFANGDGDRKLYLTGIGRVGLLDAANLGEVLALPQVNFVPVELANRVDVNLSVGKKPMGHFRVGVIVDEYGHNTRITYGQKSRCPASKVGPSVSWDTNSQDCFPQKLGTSWATFHKYLTTKVEEIDAAGGSPAMVTSYTYEDVPAWHHDDDESAVAADQSWSDWRGYGTTTITQGASKTRIRLFRGMNGDRTAAGGTRVVTVQPFTGAGFDAVPAVADEPWLAGATLVDADLGAADEVLQATHHQYEARVTAQGSADPQDWAVWTAETSATTSVAASGGGFRQQRTRTTYNTDSQPETVFEEGWLNQTGDERCSRTTYAVNHSSGMRAYPTSEIALAGSCSSNAELSHTETYYDSATTLGAPPTRGNPTRQRVKLDPSRWVTTVDTGYDSLGRVTRETNAAGHVTETAYEPTLAGGYPRTTVETSYVNGTTHVTTTEWQPAYGVPLRVTDPNGKVTSYAYDRLARLVAVRLPTEQATGSPRSLEFSYQVSPTKTALPIVRTRRLASHQAATFEDTWVVFDTALRERQTQALSPESGKVLVTTTAYDDRGLVAEEIPAQAVPGTPGTGLLSATWDNRTRTWYDTLQRPIREAWFRGGVEQWAGLTTYTHDTTTVEHPGGRKARSQVDGLGRLVRAEEWDGTAWQPTTYGYDLADRLSSVTDPAGNTITHTYNMAGWRLSMDDPDAGLWRYGYDDAGRQTTVTDATGAVTHTSYDLLNRPTARRVGGPAGALLASWSYDAAGEKGLLDRSTRVTPQGSWVVDVAGYDGRDRPTGTVLTVPAGVPGLSGSYPVGYGYDAANRVVSTTLPAVGGLPAETVTTQYNTVGLPERMVGIDEYVWNVRYDSRGRPSTAGLGPRPGGQTWLGTLWTYDLDQRLARMQAALNGAVSADHEFGYDPVGTPTSRTTQLGSQSWRECYGHDTRLRLVSAYTTTAAVCDGTLRGTGPQPYDHTYTYTADGNLKTRVEGPTTYLYTYPASGADRPHAPTAAGSASYGWNTNGNLTSRTVAGATDTFAWDVERRLASVSGPQGTDSFVYDADGARLLRTTAQGRTLYVAGHEITASLNGSTVTASRTYDFGGLPVATRTTTAVHYLLTDQQGSVEASVPSGAATPQVTRTYAPYGQQRSGSGFVTDRGWIGQVEDDNSRLSYLNARYYDPNLARFISPDPLYDVMDPQSINPYAYGSNNPIANTDPDGLKAKKPKGTPAKASAKAAAAAARAAARIAKAVAAAARTMAKAAARAAKAAKAAAKSPKKVPAKLTAVEKARRAAALRAAKTLSAMHKANPDPAFWKWIATVGARGAGKVAKQIEHDKKVAKLNRIVDEIQATVRRWIGSVGNWVADDSESGFCMFGRNPNGSCRGSSAWPWSAHASDGNYCIFGGGSNDDGGCRGAGFVAPIYGALAGAAVGLALGTFGWQYGVVGGFIAGEYMEGRFAEARDRCGGLGGMFGGDLHGRDCTVHLDPD